MSFENLIPPNRESITNYVVKNFSSSYNFDLKDYQSIKEKHFKSDTFFFDLNQYRITRKTYLNYTFPAYHHQLIVDTSNEIDYDIELNIFILLSGLQELDKSRERDKHDRFTYKNSEQCKHQTVLTPTVNILYEKIASLFKLEGLNCEPRTIDTPIIFTHDIDQLRSGWHELYQEGKQHKNLAKILKALLIKTLRLKDPHFKAFERLVDLNKKNNLESIYFMMIKKSYQDSDHSKKLLVKALGILKKEKAVIGIHPGYSTYNNQQEYYKQLNELNALSDKNITQVRQHFLKYTFPETTNIQTNLGLKEDHTLGFAEQFGLRNNTCTPFFLYDFDNNKPFYILQYPLLLMDSTLIDYLDKKELKENCDQILDSINKLKTDFPFQISVLFHNTAFANIRFKGFEEFYLSLIRHSK